MATFEVHIDTGWDVLVTPGTKVTYTSSLAQQVSPATYPQTVPLAHILGFSPKNIFRYIKKSVGEMIRKGDVVAENKTIFSSKKFTAEADGIITHIDHTVGEITFEQVLPDMSSSAMMALFEGTIGEIKKGIINVKVSKALEVKINESVSPRFGGRCLVTNSAQAMVLGLPDIGGNVVIARDFTDYSISKFEALQAQAFISQASIRSHIPTFTLKKAADYTDIVDFAPTAVYANASESTLIFYK
ncbi:MAG: hypothetical protein WCO78_05485 [Candidatus Roizmanbacteria bacterium]